MKSLSPIPNLLKVARRVVWSEEPEEAMAGAMHFLPHVMTYGTIEDLKALQGIAGAEEFREVLENAPAGVFDAKSWAYWNLKCGRIPSPPLPTRQGLQPVRPMP